MTAWPLNCTAADAAENVFWRRGASAAHRLLIDSLAVPLWIEPEPIAKTEAESAPTMADAGETKTSIGKRLARMFESR
jgi:hypothetical protein